MHHGATVAQEPLSVVVGRGFVLRVVQVNHVLVRSRRDLPAVGAVLHHFNSPCSAAVPRDPLQRRRLVDAEISPGKAHLRVFREDFTRLMKERKK